MSGGKGPLDRNEAARLEFAARRQQHELTQQRSAFALDFAAGKVGVADRNGRRVEKGQLVLFAPPPGFTYWQVVSVEPNLSPQVPPGVARVTLTAVVPLNYRVQQPCGDLLIIGQVTGEDVVGAGGVGDPAETPADAPTPPDGADGTADQPDLPADLPTPPSTTDIVDLDAAPVPTGPRLVDLTDGD